VTTTAPAGSRAARRRSRPSASRPRRTSRTSTSTDTPTPTWTPGSTSTSATSRPWGRRTWRTGASSLRRTAPTTAAGSRRASGSTEVLSGTWSSTSLRSSPTRRWRSPSRPGTRVTCASSRRGTSGSSGTEPAGPRRRGCKRSTSPAPSVEMPPRAARRNRRPFVSARQRPSPRSSRSPRPTAASSQTWTSGTRIRGRSTHRAAWSTSATGRFARTKPRTT
jgi:hypothetical protein